MRLMLWDIDGTLLRAGPVASEIFGAAVAAVTGRDPGDHGVVMSGRTDLQIAAEILGTVGIGEDEALTHVPAVLDELTVQLAANVERIRSEGRVLPGVPELLAAMDGHDDVHQTLLTGNVAANARTKTTALGLDGWFDWRLGAFGDDDGDRLRLVPLARRRATVVLGVEPEHVWVIGDTPHDAACARAGGVHCVLVATGRMSRERLDDCAAEAVVDDLSDTQAMVELLTA